VEQLMQECPQIGCDVASVLIEEADRDKDGRLTFEELFAVIQSAAK
jgi:hypothetical protein